MFIVTDLASLIYSIDTPDFIVSTIMDFFLSEKGKSLFVQVPKDTYT